MDKSLLLRNLIKKKQSELVTEMKRIGFWSKKCPQRVRMDRNSYAQFLQCTFIPQLSQALESNQLDHLSTFAVGLGAMRNYDYMSVDDQATKLVEICEELEELIVEWGTSSAIITNEKIKKMYLEEKQKRDLWKELDK